MKKWLKILLWTIGGILVVAIVALLWLTRSNAYDLVHNTLDERTPIAKWPSDYGMPYEEVTVTTEDDLKLVGWFIPSENGATVIAQHGYERNREDLLEEAEFLYRHGYGLLITSIRAHDESDGELVTFGKQEIKDMEAWYQYLLTRNDVDPTKIGMFGESMGAMLCIQYASKNEGIKAVVAHSSFSSLDDTIVKAVVYYTGLPRFPFVPLIVFWAEQIADIDTAEIDAKVWVKEISPRAVFIIQGGQDDHISNESGQWLYDAAGEPKELWFEPEAGHVGVCELKPEECESRIVAFFDEYLLGE